MYPDSGPSRSGSSYGGSKPSGRDQPPRQANGRYEPEYEAERGYGRPQEPPNRSFPNNSSPWSRPNSRPGFRPYPSGPPRARTPSPPRQTSEWDNRRDARPRERARSREVMGDREPQYRPPVSNFTVPDRRQGAYVPPPAHRDAPRDVPPRDRERNWGPGARDERYDEQRSQPRRSFSPTKQPWPRDRPNPSPPKSRGPPPVAWNGTPRVNSNQPPFQTPRDDRPERTPFRSRNSSGDTWSAQGGPGPTSSAYQASTRSSPGGTPPRTSRSVRGNSSPVEIRHRAEDPAPVPVEASVPPPKVKVEEVEEGELEEGEVMSSPVRPDAELRQDFVPAPQPRDRWREWPDDRGRAREPFDRNRDRRWHAGPARSPVRDSPLAGAQPWIIGQSVDDGWGQKRKVEEGTKEVKDEEPVEEDVKEEMMPEDDRPATPPLPSPIRPHPAERMPLPSIPPSPVESIHPPSPHQPPRSPPPLSPVASTSADALLSQHDASRPETPLLPSAGMSQQVQALLGRQSPLVSPPPRTDTPVAAYVPRQAGPSIVIQHPSTPGLPSSLETPDNSSSSKPSPPHPPSESPINAPPSEPEAVIPEPREDIAMAETPTSPIVPPSRPAFPPLLNSGPRSPVARQPTLAERRAVKLPTTQEPLSSPFGEVRRDPAPTNLTQSTESEVWPRTADAHSDYSDDPEVTRETRLVGLVRKAQREQPLDVDAIVAWNLAAAPAASARVTDLSPRKREKRLRELTWPLGQQQVVVAQLVAKQVAKEHERTQERTANLRKEYLQLDEEWREHCTFLDDLMEKRGPPPESLYAIPNAVPVVTPGPIPTTPVPLEELSSRAIRRRGAGDAVTTEAEFQEILAAMADTAAKDPNYRASKTTAAVPDMLPLAERRLRFEDDNDLVEDPIAFYDFKGNAEPVWTEEERQIFVRRYLNFPKQFGKIADGIPNKSASDCVLYYYRTKKQVDYKSMLSGRRGVPKRKTIPLKKGGKSAALLASLEQKKDTVKARMPVPARREEVPVVTPVVAVARRGGKPRMDTGARRKVVDVQVEEEESRDDEVAVKVKRTVKSKRPRVSSVAGPPTPVPLDENGVPIPQAELLPPIKRARKVAKPKSLFSEDVITLDGIAETMSAASTPGTGERTANGGVRRGNTSSYWSVEEKKRLKELVGVHQRDFRTIAAALPGKSERQIFNFCESHLAELELEPAPYDAEVDSGFNSPFTKEEYFKPSAGPGGEGRSRSIYDVYSQPFAHEPRLGVFPSLPRSGAIAAPAAPLPPRASPTQAVARSGGMRISALLNDDPLPPPDRRERDGDAQSDGTVEDRDEGFRPSSRGMPVPRRQSIEHAEAEYRRPHVGYMYQPPPPTASWSERRPTEPFFPPPRPSAVHHPQSRSSDPVPTRSYFPSSDQPHPQHQQHQLPHRSMDYYRSRPDAYRTQTSTSDPYAATYPSSSQPQRHSGPSTTPPFPPQALGGPPPREIPRYEHSQSQDWRTYRRTPPPGQPPQQQQQMGGSAPAGRAGQGWYDDSRQGVILPSIRTMYEGEERR